jgi:hypothetical protein
MLTPPQQLGITVTASLRIKAARCLQSTNFSNDLRRKLMISHTTLNLNNNYVTAQNCRVLQAIFLEIFNNKFLNTEKPYSQDRRAEIQGTEQADRVIRNGRLKAKCDS